MASVIYPKYKEALLTRPSNSDIVAGNVKQVLVDTGAYTYSASHEFLSDVAGGARIATSGNLASKTTTGGVFDAADYTLTAVTGNTAEAIVTYIDTGTASTSRLVSYADSGTGLPVTPNGGDIGVAHDNGANKIFAL